ncbi:DUF922 domain-containing protein [Lysobacter humi (ex Lee et al. 2017)]
MLLHRLFAFCIASSMPLSATAGDAGIDVDERIETYDVDGGDATTLTRQMAERGPLHQGRRAWAYTAWEVRSRYTPVAGIAGCRIESPRVRVEIVTTLPRWTATNAAPRLRARWTRLVANLVEHEDVHRQHALDAADGAQAALEALPAERDCELAALRAQEALRAQVQLAKRRSYEFDRATKFGTRAGVRLEE